jgi:hypothetical protein
MPQIGSTLCTFLRGTPPAQKQRVELWEVPGVDGYGAQLTGRGDAPFRLQAVLLSNASGCRTWGAALMALQGQVVSLTNDLGFTASGCLITRVSPLQVTTAWQPGTAITHRGEIEIEGVVVG